MNEYDETMLRRWLLHQLSADQTQPLEQQLLQDDELGARLHATETDLLDDFARDRLDATDRAAVVQHLLAAPHNRERLRFAAVLARHNAPSPTSAQRSDAPKPGQQTRSMRQPPKRRWFMAWGGLAAACAVLIVAVGLHHRGNAIPEATSTSAMTIALADPTRGATITEVRVPHAIDTIRLQAEVESSTPGTRYTLTIADRTHTVFSATDLVPREAAPYHYVNVEIAARTLGQGERIVRVAPQEVGAPTTVWRLHVAAIAAPSQNTK